MGGGSDRGERKEEVRWSAATRLPPAAHVRCAYWGLVSWRLLQLPEAAPGPAPPGGRGLMNNAQQGRGRPRPLGREGGSAGRAA